MNAALLANSALVLFAGATVLVAFNWALPLVARGIGALADAMSDALVYPEDPPETLLGGGESCGFPDAPVSRAAMEYAVQRINAATGAPVGANAPALRGPHLPRDRHA